MNKYTIELYTLIRTEIDVEEVTGDNAERSIREAVEDKEDWILQCISESDDISVYNIIWEPHIGNKGDE